MTPHPKAAGSPRRVRPERRLLPALLLLSACGDAPRDDFAVAGGAFQGPESARYDERADVYLVANVNGDPAAKDGNGFISRVSPRGRVTEPRWIEGGKNGVTLNAPKGMAFRGDTLYVADLDVVRAFDRRTGVPLWSRPVPGATFLNDLAVGGDGAVYVTDTGLRAGAGGLEPSGTDAVYRFDATGAAVPVARGAELGGPNGIARDGDGVVVVSTGSGEVYRLDAAGRRTALPKPPAGGLDGVVALGDGSYLVSSWAGSAVYRLGADGMYRTVAAGVEAPAAIGYDSRRHRLLIPQLTKDRVLVRAVAGTGDQVNGWGRDEPASRRPGALGARCPPRPR